MSNIEIRMTARTDAEALVRLSRESAIESGALHLFEEGHSREHLTDLLERGVGFAAVEDGEVIGVALFTPIDTGFARLQDLESQHIYVRPDRRSMRLVRKLFGAVQEYADANQHTILLHQVAYFSALNGQTTETKRVGALYKYFEFEGSFGATYVCRPKAKKVA